LAPISPTDTCLGDVQNPSKTKIYQALHSKLATDHSPKNRDVSLSAILEAVWYRNPSLGSMKPIALPTTKSDSWDKKRMCPKKCHKSAKKIQKTQKCFSWLDHFDPH
jgi:hypothetical protein